MKAKTKKTVSDLKGPIKSDGIKSENWFQKKIEDAIKVGSHGDFLVEDMRVEVKKYPSSGYGINQIRAKDFAVLCIPIISENKAIVVPPHKLFYLATIKVSGQHTRDALCTFQEDVRKLARMGTVCEAPDLLATIRKAYRESKPCEAKIRMMIKEREMLYDYMKMATEGYHQTLKSLYPELAEEVDKV